MPSLAVIIVSWNTRDLLWRCIETAHASLAGAEIAYQIVVVDNASIDGTPEMLCAAHPEVLLIEAGRNLGFAGANNLALRVLLDRRPTTDDRRPTMPEQGVRRRESDAENDREMYGKPLRDCRRASGTLPSI